MCLINCTKYFQLEKVIFKISYTAVCHPLMLIFCCCSTIIIFYPSTMHNKFEDKQVEYEGGSDSQSLKTFISKNVFGLCGHRTTGNGGEFSSKPLVVVYYDVDYVKNVKGTNYWRNRSVIQLCMSVYSVYYTVYIALCICVVY